MVLLKITTIFPIKIYLNIVQECNEYQSEYGAPQKTVCRTWFESECNTTYVQAATVVP